MPKHRHVSDAQIFSELHQKFVRSTAAEYETHNDFSEVVVWLEEPLKHSKKINRKKKALT